MQRQRRIHITAINRLEPDVGLYVLALVELARELQAAEAKRQPTEGKSDE